MAPRNLISALRNASSPEPELSARISERGPEFNGAWAMHVEGGLVEATKVFRRAREASCAAPANLGAVAPTHQHAILVLAQIGNAHRQPYSNGRQRDGEGEGRDVGQHAMLEVVRFLAASFEARQIRRGAAGSAPPVGRADAPGCAAGI